MDRNVFAMIAGTVFLLVMIVGTIQMQLSMIEKAAEEVETSFGAYAYPMAGAMYVITDTDNRMSTYDDIESRLSEINDGCRFLKENGDPAPGFSQEGILKIREESSEIDTECSESYSTGSYSGYYSYRTRYYSYRRTRHAGSSAGFVITEKEGGEYTPVLFGITQEDYNP